MDNGCILAIVDFTPSQDSCVVCPEYLKLVQCVVAFYIYRELNELPLTYKNWGELTNTYDYGRCWNIHPCY